jgi:hypothetical protein
MEESAAALRFGFAPAISRRACLRSVLEAVLRAQPVRVSGWLYRVLPLVQAARDLGVDSGPQAGAQHRYFPSPQNGLAEE